MEPRYICSFSLHKGKGCRTLSLYQCLMLQQKIYFASSKPWHCVLCFLCIYLQYVKHTECGVNYHVLASNSCDLSVRIYLCVPPWLNILLASRTVHIKLWIKRTGLQPSRLPDHANCQGPLGSQSDPEWSCILWCQAPEGYRRCVWIASIHKAHFFLGFGQRATADALFLPRLAAGHYQWSETLCLCLSLDKVSFSLSWREKKNRHWYFEVETVSLLDFAACLVQFVLVYYLIWKSLRVV